MGVKLVQLLSLLIALSLASGDVFKLTPEVFCRDLSSLMLTPKTNIMLYASFTST